MCVSSSCMLSIYEGCSSNLVAQDSLNEHKAFVFELSDPGRAEEQLLDLGHICSFSPFYYCMMCCYVTCLCASTLYLWLRLIHERQNVLGIKIPIPIAVWESLRLTRPVRCWEVARGEIRVPALHWFTVCSGRQIRKAAVPVQCEYCCDRNTNAALSCCSSHFFRGLFSFV